VLNTNTDVQHAPEVRMWALGGLSGRCPLSGAPTPLVHDSGVFAVAHRTAKAMAVPSQPQLTSQKYLNMTRIAAAGGNVSGSHPAWDPV
jgi:hypothetical protein